MNRMITVKGCGNVKVKPDQIELSFDLKAKDKIYDKAMEIATNQVEQLKQALVDAGFTKDSIKTTSFNIRAVYDSVRDKDRNYVNVFSGYECSHSLKLRFDFDSVRLSDALLATMRSKANPRIDIAFTVKDSSAVNELILQRAAENARKKAEILCDASGVKLGSLVGIDYNWGEVSFVSRAKYMGNDAVAAGCVPCEMDIEPDDIDAEDTVTFVWEIE